jgi:hypothetical protein
MQSNSVEQSPKFVKIERRRPARLSPTWPNSCRTGTDTRPPPDALSGDRLVDELAVTSSKQMFDPDWQAADAMRSDEIADVALAIDPQ